MWLLWSSPPGWVVSQLALLTSWRGWQQTREISVLFHPIKVTLAAAHSRCTQQISIFEACCSLMHMSITLFENGPCHLKLRPVKHQTQQSHSRSTLFSTLLLSCELWLTTALPYHQTLGNYFFFGFQPEKVKIPLRNIANINEENLFDLLRGDTTDIALT